jgi:hypothetical protein
MLHDPHLLCSDASRTQYILGSRLSDIVFLVAMLSQVDTYPTSIALDPLLLLDTHCHELLQRPLLIIDGFIIQFKDVKHLRNRVEDKINQEPIFDRQVQRLQPGGHVAHSKNVAPTATPRVLLCDKPLDQSACICL